MILTGFRMWVVISVVLVIAHFSYGDNSDELLVQIPDGKVLGATAKSENGNEYYAFYEIPFAAPPINERRFQPPEDPEPWDGILNATGHTKMCPQMYKTDRSGRLGDVVETEDCLYLSVYTPIKPGTTEDLPVLLWIPGGGFVTGASSFYDPQFYMDYDIVVVVVQYRLGPFGFLTTMDGVIPGNLALKDQRKAVNWVNSNIQYFGGDPDKVTLMGESGGAIIISYLLLDRKLEGKFRGAVQQSGSSGMRITLNPKPKQYAYELGQLLDNSFGYPNSSQQLLTLLQKSSTEQIATAAIDLVTKTWSYGLQTTGVFPDLVWSLVIEDVDVEKDPIVTAPMLESFDKGDFIKVPTILGFNSEECLFIGVSADNVSKGLAKKYDDNPSLLADERLEISLDDTSAFGNEMIQLYTNSSFDEDFGAFIRYSSDTGFVNGILAQASLSSNYTSVYVYEFSYAGDDLGTFIFDSTGLNRTTIKVPGAETVSHGEDIVYHWNSSYFNTPTEISKSDKLTRRRFLKLMANFVKYLNATPENDEDLNNVMWPRFTSDQLEYLNLNNTVTISSNPRNFKKIREVYSKYVTGNSVW